MKFRFSAAAVMILAASMMIAAGCGASASEKIAEKIAKDATGSKDVDIDSKGGTVKIKGKDGEELEISGSEGKLPDGWPDEVPLPDSAKITSGGKMATGEGASYSVSATVDESPEDTLSWYKKELDGFKESATMTTADGGYSTFTSDDYEVVVTTSKEGSDTNLALIVSDAQK